jgi:O-antigen/teichoic acid export membrane protein
VLLAPAVALLAITGGETAILKGARQLRSLAVIQIYSVFAALMVSVPLYYFFGQAAIVPVIVLMALASMLLTVAHSYRLYPLKIGFESGILGEGMSMVKLGVAFVLAGVLGSGAEMLIRAYLNNVADLDAVGLYNFGFMLTMTYGGMVFSAMETDFFPRLSGVNNDREAYNGMINKQALVSLLIISPIAIGVIFTLPIIIPLLTSKDFLPVTDMARIAALSLYLRAVNLPMEYLTLAKGDAKSYLFLEGVYDMMIVLLIIVGYHYYGLVGTGYALALSAVGNTVLVLLYMGLRFGVRLNRLLTGCLLTQAAIGMGAFFMAESTSGVVYVVSGIMLFAVSLFISVSVLRQRTYLWEKLVGKFKEKLNI